MVKSLRRSLNALRGDQPGSLIVAQSKESNLYIGPSHSFSFLRDTAGMEGMLSTANRQAHSELRPLSSILTTAEVHPPSETGTSFHVPSRLVGYRWVSLHLERR
ncbi:hypothetical protein ASPZODRAFT_137339 [Penicilliopsis zonata CBS 506.65]|uniref:Uncharacterized protein n=1 Tax=Penicilliopsis zonata CBS 506.65 TaxID=1073090 RepID=A0A1L9S5B0_9EURO|nr:hypothetical protein ASPZODRAFT_137339 [Penicilliopsis zonata CBS 506.65]OJJ42317.1 hypothetical protein ASPZODRAFT_137339 [Penicilliopsis zonata CBS 506.65]